MSSLNLKLLAVAALVALAGCGEAVDAVGQAASEAARAAGEIVDTKTACMIAGQDAAFCTCAQEALGPRLDPERLGQITDIVVAAAQSGSIEEAAQKAEIPEETRKAVIQCATRAAVQGAVSEGG
jgi:hypothetical protein